MWLFLILTYLDSFNVYWFSGSLLSNCNFDKLNWYQTNNVGVDLLVDICQVWCYLRLWSYLSQLYIQTIQFYFFSNRFQYLLLISPPKMKQYTKLPFLNCRWKTNVELELPIWYLFLISPPKMKSVHMFKYNTKQYLFFHTVMFT